MSNLISGLALILVLAAAAGFMSPESGTRAAQPPAPTAGGAHEPKWVVDPTVSEDSLPSVGRSLFDFFITARRGDNRVYDVPYPFSALIKRLEAGLQPDASGAPPLKRVLIPLGRSLQRTAGAPEFFRYPRAVVALDTESRVDHKSAGILLKDRLYLGFQEKSNLIEVISYNEAAGRFEFQVVKDYRPGGDPKVFYANRSLCMSCHQNGAPIFPRQVWNETNANPRIAALLRNERRDFYGIKPDRGIDVPNAIDDATDRANLFSAYQLLWRNGCASNDDDGIRCRAGLFMAVLQYRLSGNQQFEARASGYRDDVVATVARNGREQWPDGLHIPNPDIPNRDPLAHRPGGLAATGGSNALAQESAHTRAVLTHSLTGESNVAAPFDPLNPRPPLETWSMSEPAAISRRVVAGLSEFVAESDIRRLDAHLSRQAAQRRVPNITYEAACDIDRTQTQRSGYRIDFRCPMTAANPGRGAAMQGRFYVHAGTVADGSIDRLTTAEDGEPGGEVRNLDIAGGKVASASGRWSATVRLARGVGHVRRADGHAVVSVQLVWPDASRAAVAAGKNAGRRTSAGRGTVTVAQDFLPVHAAIAGMVRESLDGKLDAFSNRPFRRASAMHALFARLGMKPLAWCCLDDAGMPPPATEPSAGITAAGDAAVPALSGVQLFYRYCANCHQSADRFPPNFLQGSLTRVTANLAQCAQRLYVRLSMWQLPQERRPKTPMPPVNALYGLHLSPEAWRESGELALLRGYVGNILQAQSGKAPRPEELMSGGYESLRACLPEAS